MGFTIDDSASTLYISSIPFFIPIITRLEEFPKLKKVSIKLPTSIVLRAGEDSPGQKSFEILSIDANGYKLFQLDEREIMMLTKRITSLVGTGLTEVSGLVLNPSQDFSLQASFFPFRSTLRTLELSSYMSPFSVTEIWEFATQCTQLASLSLELFALGEGTEELEMPEDIKGLSGLKKLELIIGGIRFSFEAQRGFVSWIGRVLEEFHFDYGSSEPGPFLSCSILQNSRESLKEVLLLGHIGNQEEVQQLQLGKFPNL